MKSESGSSTRCQPGWEQGRRAATRETVESEAAAPKTRCGKAKQPDPLVSQALPANHAQRRLLTLFITLAAVLLPSQGSSQDPQTPRPLIVPRPDKPEIVIRLDSGEWLRGRLETLNYGRLHINSAKLDKLNFDWDDIIEFYSSATHEYFFREKNCVDRGTGKY